MRAEENFRAAGVVQAMPANFDVRAGFINLEGRVSLVDAGNTQPAARQPLDLFDHFTPIQQDHIDAVVESVIGRDIMVHFSGKKFGGHAVAKDSNRVIDATCECGRCLSSHFH